MAWTNWVGIGSIFAGLGVGLGAFGAHALKSRLTDYQLEIFETAVRYQMYHALALLAVALVASYTEHFAVKIAGFSFIVGILLFSGSLYTLVATGMRWLGAITPLGGIAFLIGWLCLAIASFR